ncbi:MAG: C13 family peptidase [Candidatus Hermodarchaeota archaeon]
MNKRKLIPIILISVIFVSSIVIVLFLFLPSGQILTTGNRKAIILSSANDYYRKDGEPEFNEGNEAKFNQESNNWTVSSFVNMFGAVDSTSPGYDGLPGVLRVFAAGAGYGNFEFVFNWTKFYPIYNSTAYYLSVWVNITTISGGSPIIGPPNGVRVGLRWLNSSNGLVRTDWSNGIFDTITGWTLLNVSGVNNNTIGYEITQLQLVLSVEGIMAGNEMILFDDVRVEHWFPPPIPIPIPSNIDSDGFPAQALQVYWILKDHGYTDDNIFLMLYHTGDDVIDIEALDGIPNDLNRSGIIAEIDVENDDVNASRFKRELDVSIPGSFVSNITPSDQLVIYMVDHGSNRVLGDGNATFHFEADDSYITETEFFNLVKLINCARMLINIDICFSGNFLNEYPNIGQSWYNIPNSLLITSTSNILSWYWRDNINPEGFAGSWFFHQFWDQLDQNQTIGAAFNFAKNYVPIGYANSIDIIQKPLLEDNLGIKDLWSFTSNPQL